MSTDGRKDALAVLHECIRNCVGCSLHASMPFKPVCGSGPAQANLMVVGEAPGHDESIVEEPFYGMAGRMLDRLLKEAGIDRKSIYICNTVNCRPTKNEGKSNRPPTKTEIKACHGWLFKQIEVVKPRVIFTLGKIPTYTLLGLKPTMKLHDFVGIEQTIELNGHKCDVIPALHPSYILQYGHKELESTVEVFKKGLNYV